LWWLPRSLDVTDPGDDHAHRQAERSRSLRIGLLESGFNLMATLPADTFLEVSGWPNCSPT
jgi:response regulator NasT